MAVHASHAALDYPIKGARFSLYLPYLDADGDPTAPTTPDTEFSLDGGAAADCAEEASAVSGMDGIALFTVTGAETNGSALALNAKVASGPKATLVTLYPRALATVGSGTLSAGSAGGGTLGTLLAYDVAGCFIKTTGGTGGGGTGGANNQARRIATYNTGTGAFTVDPNWETTPDNTTTYDVKLPAGVTLGMLKSLNSTSPVQTAGDIYAVVNGRLPAALTANGNLKASFVELITTALTEGATGRLKAALTTFLDVASPVFTAASVNQSGDNFTRIGAAGAGLTALPEPATLLLRLTSIRAGYLDNLSGGAVATAAQVSGLAVNTRANLNVPVEIETPDASTQVYKIRLHLFDVEGNMEAPDSTPTVSLTNAAGTDRSGRLSAGSNPSTGVYTWDYTATAGDAEEQLVWVFTVVEGGLTRTYPATSYVVDETAYRFSSTDRSNLTAVKAKTDNLPAAPASTTNITAGTITTATNLTNAPTNGDFTAAMKTSLNASTPAGITGSISGSVSSVSGNVDGSVGGNIAGNVQGDVEGKLLGGGGTAIAGVGAQVGAVASVTAGVTLAANQDVRNVLGAVTGAVASVTAPVTVATNNDKTGYSLAAAGLDAITATEPTTKPTNFRLWLMWLVQRFRRADMTATGLDVKTEAGAVVTSQVLSDNGTIQSMGPPV